MPVNPTIVSSKVSWGKIQFSVRCQQDFFAHRLDHGAAWEAKCIARCVPVLKESKVVVDCGAHIGNHALIFSLYADKVIAIEPFDDNHELLVQNVQGNNRTNIEVHKALLSDSPRTYAFGSSYKNVSATHFYEDPNGTYTSSRLDDLVQGRVDFLKIDVEGMEYDLVRGADRIIRENHPFIFIEIHRIWERDMIPKMTGLLRQYGYNLPDPFVDPCKGYYYGEHTLIKAVGPNRRMEAKEARRAARAARWAARARARGLLPPLPTESSSHPKAGSA